ncbi:MAG: secretin and TonB N-terminal domain-containing protein [Labilithrix sp.]|nr:secretin and TonB N-terminal domain-containing protein [Labilithrix sp.]MCW5812498.1 secretin and TonB N-terminal domain-containing protein [Labilithrix sp.]
MRHVGWALACALAATACANDAPPPTTPRTQTPAPELDLEISRPAAPSLTDRFATKRIGETPPPIAHGTGRPIDLDVKDADIHDVLRLLADVGHVSLVVPAEVTGRVSLQLRRVPWDQALATIAQAKGLHTERTGDVVTVTPR